MVGGSRTTGQDMRPSSDHTRVIQCARVHHRAGPDSDPIADDGGHSLLAWSLACGVHARAVEDRGPLAWDLDKHACVWFVVSSSHYFAFVTGVRAS